MAKSMTEQIKRVYFSSKTYAGVEIVSTLEDEPVRGSDGWSHAVDGTPFTTLAAAIKYAKTIAKRNGEPLTPTTATSSESGDIDGLEVTIE